MLVGNMGEVTGANKRKIMAVQCEYKGFAVGSEIRTKALLPF